jgi:Fe2+ or Zn2+ uptake regulation protein
MPGRVSSKRYSAVQEGEFRVRVIDILNNSDEALTIEEIKNQDMILSPLTSQKLSRVLGYLVQMGLVKKAKAKSGRMVYKAVSKMIEQGYEVDDVS